jgi:hypothetical protein
LIFDADARAVLRSYYGDCVESEILTVLAARYTDQLSERVAKHHPSHQGLQTPESPLALLAWGARMAEACASAAARP